VTPTRDGSGLGETRGPRGPSGEAGRNGKDRIAKTAKETSEDSIWGDNLIGQQRLEKWRTE